jgi:hypothetical protein
MGVALVPSYALRQLDSEIAVMLIANVGMLTPQGSRGPARRGRRVLGRRQLRRRGGALWLGGGARSDPDVSGTSHIGASAHTHCLCSLLSALCSLLSALLFLLVSSRLSPSL